MKKNIYLLSSILILGGLSTSCNSKENNKDVPNTKVEAQNEPTKTDTNLINPFDNYFATSKVTANTELSLDSAQFAKDFQFAATMNNKPATINFAKEKVGAIVLPETAFDTEIILDSNFVKNDTLHVVYKIEQGKNENTYTTVPVKLFSYESKYHLLFEKK